MPDRAPRSPAFRTQARQVGLVRILLLSLALGVLVILVGSGRRELVEPAATWLQRVLVAVTIVAFPLLGAGWLVRHRWQLAALLGFDLAWSALIIHFSGGVGSPGVLLPPIIVLVGTLALPRSAPFALPAVGSALLTGSAALYLTGHAPFGEAFLALNPALVDAQRVIGSLITQIAALFLVDLLGQLLGRRLHEQRIFTGELLDQLGEGVLAIDHQGVIAYANAEAVRLLRLGGPVQGLQVSALLGDETLRPILALLEQGECPALDRAPGPQGRQLVLRVTQLLDRRGVPIGRTLLIADETRLKILEDSAHRAEHLLALGEMAAGIAHEVRNPLTSLRGCAQELAEISAEGGQRDAESLARILVSEADRLARIVEDFLALSRLRTPLRESVELAPLFAELETLCRGRGDLPDGLKLLFSVSERLHGAARRPRADPPGARQPAQQRPRRAAPGAGAVPGVRGAQRRRGLPAARARHRDRRHRQRLRHPQGHPDAHLHALLQHQEPGHRPGPEPGAAHRARARGRPAPDQRPGQGHHRADLPAGAHADAGVQAGAGGAVSSAQRGRPGPQSFSERIEPPRRQGAKDPCMFRGRPHRGHDAT